MYASEKNVINKHYNKEKVTIATELDKENKQSLKLDLKEKYNEGTAKQNKEVKKIESENKSFSQNFVKLLKSKTRKTPIQGNDASYIQKRDPKLHRLFYSDNTQKDLFRYFDDLVKYQTMYKKKAKSPVKPATTREQEEDWQSLSRLQQILLAKKRNNFTDFTISG